jgi:hypothetical protein
MSTIDAIIREALPAPSPAVANEGLDVCLAQNAGAHPRA